MRHTPTALWHRQPNHPTKSAGVRNPRARWRRHRVAPVVLVLLLAGGCSSGQTGVGIDLVPAQQVEQMGLQTWQDIRSKTPLSKNSAYRARAENVSDKVLRAAGYNPAEWEVAVFAGDEVNAFAVPGKRIGIYEGMFGVAETDAELAAVIGHEIAHVEADHAGQRVNTQLVTQLGIDLASQAAGMANAADPQLVAQVLGLGAQYGVALPYSRTQELQADEIGLQSMARAGYDPRAAVALWQKMAASGGPQPPTFLATHPAPGQRIAALEKNMASALAIYRGNR